MVLLRILSISVVFLFFAILFVYPVHAQTTSPIAAVTPTGTPSDVVPSSACLGSCPTLTPTPDSATITVAPTADPCLGQNPGGGLGGGGFGGFFQMIFQLLLQLLGGFGSTPGTGPCLGQTPAPIGVTSAPISTVGPVSTVPGTSPSPGQSQFTCSGASIAAFANQLVNEVRSRCTANGTGVVTNTSYSCLQDSIDKLAPPYSSVAKDRVVYWSQNGNDFAGKTEKYQCVELLFVATGALCGQVMNNGKAADIGTNQQIPGYTFIAKGQGSMQVGDLVATYGHVAIVAEVLDSNKVRMAEANNLNPDGSVPDRSSGQTIDTGVFSNTRIATMDDPNLIGWYRKQ